MKTDQAGDNNQKKRQSKYPTFEKTLQKDVMHFQGEIAGGGRLARPPAQQGPFLGLNPALGPVYDAPRQRIVHETIIEDGISKGKTLQELGHAFQIFKSVGPRCSQRHSGKKQRHHSFSDLSGTRPYQRKKT
ncbi:MAG: hypothetical protein OEZ19_06195 [Paracoccaceae bacterium]|nr:hypothetical protein [Paracoccaceae bacterium]